MNRRRLLELKRGWLKPQDSMFDQIDRATRGQRGPGRISCKALLGGMIYLFLTSQNPTLANLERVFREDASAKERWAFRLRKPPTRMQLSWSLRRLCEYLDPRADPQKLQVVRLRQLFGEPGEPLKDLFGDWAVASTVPLASKRKIRTVDGSYINA